MKNYRREMNAQQTELRRMMTETDDFQPAMQLFRRQHALLHAQAMAGSEDWSLEDELFIGLGDAQIRRGPPATEHSIAWCVWHIARIEDVAMNMLVAGVAQVIDDEAWPARLNVAAADTGNALSDDEVAGFSAAIDIPALRAYRLAVGRRTQAISAGLGRADLRRKVDPARIEQVRAAGAVPAGAAGIIAYWSKRTVAGLLLMPATRHSLVHLNEAMDLKSKR